MEILKKSKSKTNRENTLNGARQMRAISKIMLLIDADINPQQLSVLQHLAEALESGQNFDLANLYEIDMCYFELAIELMREWRFDRHIPSRNELMSKLAHESSHACSQMADTSSQDCTAQD